ncbi:MAG: isochorismatase family protein [Rhodospirillales bacterium]|nr:isochorismatase family protein [Rhodospirillales bacterium]
MTFLDTLRRELPIAAQPFDGAKGGVGLVLVDLVNGFATTGAGALAPPEPNDDVIRMVAESDRLARAFAARNQPILAFLDTHVPGKPEPPYPPHCEAGSGEERLVPALLWLESCKQATLIRKDCINGFVGAIDPASGRNAVVDWVNANRLTRVLVLGICTDICVMDFVLTLLSARNHGLMPGLADVVVHAEGCATYDLGPEAVKAYNLPETARHPQAATHHIGLYLMASRGALLASSVR